MTTKRPRPTRRIPKFEATQIGGLSARNSMNLLDEQGHRQHLTVRAFLAHTTEVPLILGFQDCLEKATRHVAIPRTEAWLEFEEERRGR